VIFGYKTIHIHCKQISGGSQRQKFDTLPVQAIINYVILARQFFHYIQIPFHCYLEVFLFITISIAIIFHDTNRAELHSANNPESNTGSK